MSPNDDHGSTPRGASLGARLCALLLLLALVTLGGPIGGCPCGGGQRVYLDEDFEGYSRGTCPWGAVTGRARLVSTIHANQVGMSLDEAGTAIRRQFDGGLAIGGVDAGYGYWPSLVLISSCVDGAGRSTLSLEVEVRTRQPADGGPGAQGGAVSGAERLVKLPVSCSDSDPGRYHGCAVDLTSLDAGAGFVVYGLTIRTHAGPCVVDRLSISQGVDRC